MFKSYVFISYWDTANKKKNINNSQLEGRFAASSSINWASRHDKVDRNRPPEILKETSENQEKIVGGQTTMAIQKPGQTLYFEFAAHQY